MICPHCGHQSAPDSNFCCFCGTAAQKPASLSIRRLVRPRRPRIIAGVCSGIALYYGWDVAWVRVLFAVFTCLTTGIGILVYLAAWLLLPEAQYALSPGSHTGSPA